MAAAGEVLTQAVSRPHSDAKTSTTDDGLSAFVGVRSRLFAIAYRMLGSAAEAEDIVQDAWLRWQTTDRSVVRDPHAFLAATTTRLCINVVQSARSRHETCVGPWLPEPVDTSANPALGAERGESLRLAVLVLLAKLCPTERAAYVLREAFDYPHRQIADILQMEEANVRQLVSRARKHLVDGRRAYVCAADQQRLLVTFITACQTGDLAALEGLLAADVVSSPDGGGVVRAARVPVSCRERIAKFIAAVAKQLWEGVSLDWVDINGQGALLMHDCASARSLR
jgi:RNA polymerase sigma-70 factor, ECF subfamily